MPPMMKEVARKKAIDKTLLRKKAPKSGSKAAAQAVRGGIRGGNIDAEALLTSMAAMGAAQQRLGQAGHIGRRPSSWWSASANMLGMHGLRRQFQSHKPQQQ